MEKYLETLNVCPLFRVIRQEYLKRFLSCANARVASYLKGETLLISGFPVFEFGIILSGEIEALQEDYSGNQLIISRLKAPEMFGEVIACSSERKSPVTVIAVEHTKVLYVDYPRLSFCCENSCSGHRQVIQNLLTVLADKYFILNSRIGVLIKKSVRAKLALYLIKESESVRADIFPAALNKTSLACFLNIDRSAMSRELSRMKAEGIIDFDRKSYTVLRPDILKEIAS